jgi:glycosyltransferase involved in cell wall biosynthesis
MICLSEKSPNLKPRPIRVMFVTSRMCIGGEEMLLVELIRRLDRSRFAPELCCLKFRGELGEKLANEIPVWSNLLACKWDFRVWGRLTQLLRRRRIDAVITVGTGGDRMFWGRLAALRAGVPVIMSAIHSTGWPTRIEWLNRKLATVTDAFIAVANLQRQYLVQHAGCPPEKMHVIPNGVDTRRFQPRRRNDNLAEQLGIPASAPVAGVVAEMRPEKNLSLWLQAAVEVRKQVPTAHFLIVGDGQQRDALETMARQLRIERYTHFAGRRRDVPELLALMDVFVLSSTMEANPVSILEAMAGGKPVVSTDVGSISEAVVEARTGYLVASDDCDALAGRIAHLLMNHAEATGMGQEGRRRIVDRFSVEQMVRGYEDLIATIYAIKTCRLQAGEVQGSPGYAEEAISN